MFIVKIKLDDTERDRGENNHPSLAAKNILSYFTSRSDHEQAATALHSLSISHR